MRRYPVNLLTSSNSCSHFTLGNQKSFSTMQIFREAVLRPLPTASASTVTAFVGTELIDAFNVDFCLRVCVVHYNVPVFNSLRVAVLDRSWRMAAVCVLFRQQLTCPYWFHVSLRSCKWVYNQQRVCVCVSDSVGSKPVITSTQSRHRLR